MIKFLATGPSDRRILGLIVTAGNLERLIEKQPIHINAEELGLPAFNMHEIVVIFYPTEQDAIEDMTSRGVLTQNTKINVEDKH